MSENSNLPAQPSKNNHALKKHGGEALAGGAAISGGSGIFFSLGNSATAPDIDNQAILEGLDRALSVDLFLSIGGVSLAVVALLVPILYEQSKKLKDIGSDIRADSVLFIEFSRIVRAQKRLLVCFSFCLIGVASSFAFDGPLEYLPPGFQEASMSSQISNYAGPEWADLAESSVSSTILLAALCWLGLGAKSFFTAINSVYNMFEKKT